MLHGAISCGSSKMSKYCDLFRVCSLLYSVDSYVNFEMFGSNTLDKILNYCISIFQHFICSQQLVSTVHSPSHANTATVTVRESTIPTLLGNNCFKDVFIRLPFSWYILFRGFFSSIDFVTVQPMHNMYLLMGKSILLTLKLEVTKCTICIYVQYAYMYT